MTLSPQALGLPPKFQHYRVPPASPIDQVDIITRLSSTSTRWDLFPGSTGSGKTVVNVSVAMLHAMAHQQGTVDSPFPYRILYLTADTKLQQQLVDDFPFFNIIWGASRYPCNALLPGGELHHTQPGNRNPTCDRGPCRLGYKCSLRDAGCLRYDAIRAANNSSFVVSNYDLYISMSRYLSSPDAPHPLGAFDFLICDEAHAAPYKLANHATVTLYAGEVKKLLQLTLPDVSNSTVPWGDWCSDAHVIAQNEFKFARVNRQTDKMFRLMKLGRDLAQLAQSDLTSTDWIVEPTDKGVKFSPLWGHQFANEYLWRDTPKILLSSASLLPAITQYLNIPSEKSTYHDIPSAFAPSRRPLYYVHFTPKALIDHRTMKVEGKRRNAMRHLDAIITARPGVNIVIHSRSFYYAEMIQEMSEHRGDMIVHRRGAELPQLIRMFAARPYLVKADKCWREFDQAGVEQCIVELRHVLGEPGFNVGALERLLSELRDVNINRIIVSPSMYEGVDLPYDQCRVGIAFKVPSPYTSTPLMRARAQQDPHYSTYLTALNITQMPGRGMRHPDDYCEFFMLDGHWLWFKRKADDQGMWMSWFKLSFRQVNSIPRMPSYE